jgi:hypothetical protein
MFDVGCMREDVLWMMDERRWMMCIRWMMFDG